MVTKRKAPTYIRCARCQVLFEARRVGLSQYCGGACKQATYRQRAAEAKVAELEGERKAAVAVALAEGGSNSTVSGLGKRSVLDRLLRRDIAGYPAQPDPVTATIAYSSPTHGDRQKPSNGRPYDLYAEHGGPSAYLRAKMLSEAGPAQPANPNWDLAAWQQQQAADVLARAARRDASRTISEAPADRTI